MRTGFVKFHAAMVATLGILSGARYVGAEVVPGTPFETDAPESYAATVYASSISGAGNGTTQFAVFEASGILRGMSVGADGNPVWSQMLDVTPVNPEQMCYDPNVAIGEDLLLVGCSSSEVGVAVQRFDLDGNRLGASIQLDDNGFYPHIVWNGSAFLVAWMTLSNTGREIAVARVATDGSVSSTAVVQGSLDATEPAFAMGDNGGIIAWYANPETQSNGVFAVQVDRDGVADENGAVKISSEDGGYDVRVTTDGNDLFAVWQKSSSGIAGRMLTEAGWRDEFTIAEGDLSAPEVAFDKTGYVVFYEDWNASTGKMRFHLVSTAGVPAASSVVASSLYANSSTPPSLVSTADGVLVVYQGESAVWAQMMDATLETTTDAAVLSLMPHSQDSGTVLFDGEDYVIVWADERDGDALYSLHAVRVSQNGEVKDVEAMHLSDAAHRGSYAVAASAGDGMTLAVWPSWNPMVEAAVNDGSFLRTIGGDGTVGELTMLSETTPASVSIATDGTEYLAVFVDDATPSEVAFGVFLDSEGKPKGTPVPLYSKAGNLSAWINEADDAYLLSYRDEDTYLMPVASDGTLSSPLLVTSGQATLQTATNGTQTLVVYYDAGGVRYGRFYADGAWQGSTFLIAENGLFGDTVWDGSRFVAVWETDDDVVQARAIAPDGTLSKVETLFDDAMDCSGQQIASNGGGQLLLSCVRYRDAYLVRRIANYLIEPPAWEMMSDDTGNDTDDKDTADSEADTETSDKDTASIDTTETDSAFENTDPDTVTDDALNTDMDTETTAHDTAFDTESGHTDSEDKIDGTESFDETDEEADTQAGTRSSKKSKGCSVLALGTDASDTWQFIRLLFGESTGAALN